MTTMLVEATLRIPPFLISSTVPGSVTEIPVESWPTFATLYFAASWLSRESPPPFCELAIATGIRPKRITATVCTVLQAFPFIANSFLPMSLPCKEKLLLKILFQSYQPSNRARGTRAKSADRSPAALVVVDVNRCRRQKRLPALPSRLDLLRPLALSGQFQP